MHRLCNSYAIYFTFLYSMDFKILFFVLSFFFLLLRYIFHFDFVADKVCAEIKNMQQFSDSDFNHHFEYVH